MNTLKKIIPLALIAALSITARAASLADTEFKLPAQAVQVRANWEDYNKSRIEANRQADRIFSGMRDVPEANRLKETTIAFNELIENHSNMGAALKRVITLFEEAIQDLKTTGEADSASGSAFMGEAKRQSAEEARVGEQGMEDFFGALSLASPETASPEQLQAAADAQKILNARHAADKSIKDMSGRYQLLTRQSASMLTQLTFYHRILVIRSAQIAITQRILEAKRALFGVELASKAMFGRSLGTLSVNPQRFLDTSAPVKRLLYGKDETTPAYSNVDIKIMLRKRAEERARQGR